MYFLLLAALLKCAMGYQEVVRARDMACAYQMTLVFAMKRILEVTAPRWDVDG